VSFRGILYMPLTTTLTASAARDAEIEPRRRRRLESISALALPLSCTLALAAIGLLPSVRQHPRLFSSIVGTAFILLVALALLRARTKTRVLTVDVVVRRQHYVQACMQSTVLLYWGWYWQPVYNAAPLIAAQLAFAYAFDMLLAWWRRDVYTLGFGPFPVIFSINLFLWFKPDWFYLQFLMIAVGFAAKDLIRWKKEGRTTHIFNPSSFPLAIASLGLILTGTTSWTWGPEIAQTQFNPPNIYLLLFLVGLPGQLLFGVTPMTMSAVLTTYLLGLGYVAVTGSYFFVGSYIPIAAFLGMHLLFTDPSTAPRTELGRIMFGIIYGVSVTALYAILGMVGAPRFYDKLLPVPLMNLSIKMLDRIGMAIGRVGLERLWSSWPSPRRNLAYVAIWSVAFIALSAVDGIGDDHPGRHLPFWQHACEANARHACENLAPILDAHCRDGSGWACNEIGVLRWHRKVVRAERASADFSRACELGVAPGCLNMRLPEGRSANPIQAPPRLQDYPVVLRTGKGPVRDTTPSALLTRACDHGFSQACRELIPAATTTTLRSR